MAPSATARLSFADRAAHGSLHPLAAYLYRLMAIKQTNLCVSADVNSTTALLRLAEEVGDYICVLKTHADIVDDWGDRTVRGLRDLARRKAFLIFEDRKFGDIGSTVEQQYTRGPLRIAEWAHIVNAHLLPGPDIISALHAGAAHIEQRLTRSVSTEIFVGTPEVSEEDDGDDESPLDNPAHRSAPADSPPATARPSLSPTQSTSGSGTQKPSRSNSKDPASVRATTTIYQTMDPNTPNSTLDDRAAALHSLGEAPIQRALILLAQMSNKGNRADKDYTAACVTAAKDSDFVIGFVAQEDLNQAKGDNFLTFTPGVNLPPEGEDGKERQVGDGKGQQYRTPREILGKHGCDVVIVGRGIIKARDRPREANRYRREAWKAYEARLGGKQNGHAKKK